MYNYIIALTFFFLLLPLTDLKFEMAANNAEKQQRDSVVPREWEAITAAHSRT